MAFALIADFIKKLFPEREQISLHEPFFGGNESKYLIDCIDSTFVSSVGKYVDQFEDMIKAYTGIKHAVATVNGTAALHTALLLAGVQTGDLVITQALTFIATCNAISYCGATPVFIDIDRSTLGMSAEDLELWLRENADVIKRESGVSEERPNEHICIDKASGRKISACVPMHTYGHPCEIDRIVDICNLFHLPVVEDSAESLGSTYNGKHTGTFGMLGILSFNGNKTITTGGGGMILTDDDRLGKLAKHITTTAKKPHPWIFDHDMTGFNYRMPNINAALGCAQMENIAQILCRKRTIAKSYEEFFNDISDVEFIKEPSNCLSNYWLNAILLEDEVKRDGFLMHSNKVHIQTRPAWRLMSKLDMFSNAIGSGLQVSIEMESRLVNIPSGA